MPGPARARGLGADALYAGAMPAHEAPRPLSVADLFKIGLGPSSSHTVGPMKAGYAFAKECLAVLRDGPAPRRITVDLYGSLGATGRGHATDLAVVWGLAGFLPDSVPMDIVENLVDRIGESGELVIAGEIAVPFSFTDDVALVPDTVLDYHVNGVTFTLHGDDGVLLERTYYSVGGGFVVEQIPDDELTDEQRAEEATAVRSLSDESKGSDDDCPAAPYPFASARQLLDHCAAAGLSVSDVVRANEESSRIRIDVDKHLDAIWDAMSECIDAGCRTDGTLPGGLGVPRRAAKLYSELSAGEQRGPIGDCEDPLRAVDWVNLYALAVNEENAAGHRVVTAPTNGAAGIVPAVIKYYLQFVPDSTTDGVRRFLLAATAIGSLIKTNASIAGAEVGCQGEVGSASAMAAGGLCEAMGGTPSQVENAAEIAMEHNLGLTCDPVGGLVQIPCIERNAIGAMKAINAARMALWGDGRHTVSLDVVIETMRQTGEDMLSKYKETSTGGLAVNVVEC
ncbi:L-serine ammonia-lyase [Bowdeniella nasicola]|uniref:L-serine dehydratase n=1 Tax=Bowdeniella nasicola TaxID=208480 RepID=A0A1Q5Q1S2_9ACTO|nr:L-serine ammonia-lyase [Bowdeniella nasicola]OKL53791.1 L-serine ammonia-lyase [Bowdeniella nasicola]